MEKKIMVQLKLPEEKICRKIKEQIIQVRIMIPLKKTLDIVNSLI